MRTVALPLSHDLNVHKIHEASGFHNVRSVVFEFTILITYSFSWVCLISRFPAECCW
jgi:hypothetical protein